MLFTRRWRQDFFLSTFHDEWNLLLECTTITISEQSISHSIQTSAVQWLTNHSTSSLFAVCCSQSPTLLCLHLEGKIVVCLFVCFKLTSIFELHSSIEPIWDLFKSTNSFVLNFARLDKGRLCYHTHTFIKKNPLLNPPPISTKKHLCFSVVFNKGLCLQVVFRTYKLLVCSRCFFLCVIDGQWPLVILRSDANY